MTVSQEKIDFTRRLRKLGFNSYNSYLGSSHWKEVRFQYYCRMKKKCYICETKDNLNLHHKTYENLGEEKFEDLTYLCSSCHKIVHYYVDKDMLKLDLSDLTANKIRNSYDVIEINEGCGKQTGFFDMPVMNRYPYKKSIKRSKGPRVVSIKR